MINGEVSPALEMSVEIELDKKRRLYFGLGALQTFRSFHQKSPFRIIDKELVTTDEDGSTYVDTHWLTALIHAGLLHQDNKITVAKVGELVHERCIAGTGYMAEALALAEVVWRAFIAANLVNQAQVGGLLAKASNITSWLLARDGQKPEVCAYVASIIERGVAADTAGVVETAMLQAQLPQATIDEVLALVKAQLQPAEALQPDPTPAVEEAEAVAAAVAGPPSPHAARRGGGAPP